MPNDARSKLDPTLAELLEHDAGREATVTVLISLVGPADAAVARALEEAGLTIRSVIGDVLTGIVAIDDLLRVARVPAVRTIEGGRTLEPEGPAPTE